jgi:hypothetical protein
VFLAGPIGFASPDVDAGTVQFLIDAVGRLLEESQQAQQPV